MALIRRGQAAPVNDTPEQSLVRRLRAGQVVPIISGNLTYSLLFGQAERLIDFYLEQCKLAPPPETTALNLAALSQQYRLTEHAPKDLYEFKSEYQDWVNSLLFQDAEATHPATFMDEVAKEFNEPSFNQRSLAKLCERLKYPRQEGLANPLALLAEFPLPLYVTTSHHGLLEAALHQRRKTPQTVVCGWNKGLKEVAQLPKSEPSEMAPWVYHLHGIDEQPASLVLTENDYWDFLIASTQNIGKDTDCIAARVREKLSRVDTSLILLGYQLADWEFKTLFWGLIKQRPLDSEQQPMSVHVQLPPAESERNYLKDYLKREANFVVEWSDTLSYIQKLYEVYKS